MAIIARFVILLFLWTQDASATSSHCVVETSQPKARWQYSVGDAQNCPDSSKPVLGVLPGTGWDNLQNLHTGQVLDLTYSECRLTPDRRYLVPDDVVTVPLKASDLHLTSDVMTHFSNYTSEIAFSINVKASAPVKGVTLSGSFTPGYQHAKALMSRHRTVTSRTEMRYELYTIRAQPDHKLHTTFKTKLLDIVSFLQTNDTETAWYLANLLVRDYGTHCVTSVTAGAAIVKEDQLDFKYYKSKVNDIFSITISAGMAFQEATKAYVGFDITYNRTMVKEYKSMCMDTRVKSYGGPVYRGNYSLDQWLEGLDNNLVAVDVDGKPLYHLLTPRTLPELSPDNIRDLAAVVKEAVRTYYSFNMYPGCTDPDSPNFSYIANVEDGSCSSPVHNYTLGGVYQMCTGGACAGQTQVNPATGEFSCPQGYDAYLLQTFDKRVHDRRCKSILGVSYNCHDDWTSKSCRIETFWCAATSSVSRHTGYLFGGTFTSTTANLLTGTMHCPAHFMAVPLGYNGEMSVCIGSDFELGSRHSLPFAGFFSCKGGNPLALKGPAIVKSSGDTVPVLESYVYEAGPTFWPSRCPEGFSQHLWDVNYGCEIHYCIKANALDERTLPNIRLPPYTDSGVPFNSTRLLVTSMDRLMVKMAGDTDWKLTNLTVYSDVAVIEQLVLQVPPSATSRVAMTVALSVMGTALVGIIILMLVIYWLRKQRGSSSYRQLTSVAGEGATMYGSMGAELVQGEAQTTSFV